MLLSENPSSTVEKCSHGLIEELAATRPDAWALIYKDQRLTYEQLNLKANQLAHFLRRSGVGPEVLVGVHMERSPEAVIALLAVMKAGGAFVILEPGSPRPALEEVIRHAPLAVILTSETASANPFAGADSKVIDLDRASHQIAGESPDNLGAQVSLDNAAYVVYTSGSTGKPKGVVRPHRGLVTRVPWTVYERHEVCAHNMSLSFDYAVARLFVPLMCGVPVAIIPRETYTDAAQFASALEIHDITNIALVPSAFRQLLQLDPQNSSRLSGIRTITVGGTAFPSDLMESFRQVMPRAKLWNQYGSSEGGLIAIADVTSKQEEAAAVEPLHYLRVHILDANMQRVPVGTVAELYIGGPHLARGYLRDPALTAERFVPDPTEGAIGERLYRTGDLGRYLSTGKIELFGRADRQVKIRGFRVEVEAIEADLNQHEDIEEVAVVAREIDRETRLIAYVVSKKGTPLSAGQLHRYMRGRLPAHMIPFAFVPLERLPLTGHGKLDVSGLPLPGAARPELSTAYEAPRDSTEAAIAQIWAAQLGLDQVGIHDNFIELGGDSLIAAKIVSRTQETLGVKVPFRAILEGAVSTCAAECRVEIQQRNSTGG